MPVCSECGMVCQLKEELEIKYRGQIYCFCSRKCKERFEKEKLKRIKNEIKKEHEKQRQAMMAEALDE